MKISDIDIWIKKINKYVIMSFGFVICIILGWAGLYVGNEFSFSIFYIIPVMLVAWYAGWLNGIIISLFAALTWYAGEMLAGRAYPAELIPYMNTLARAILYLIFSYLVYTIRKQLSNQTLFANEDFLTKISNSRAFYNYAALEIARLKRYKEPFTLAYFDVDNFKGINDIYGHNAGDALLVELARAIRKNIRPTDVVARLGGDEFGILLLETSPAQARATMTKLQKVMKNTMARLNRDITFSFGVVTFLRAPGSTDDMIKKADDMMYQSKHAGKDTINYFVYR